MSAKIKHYLLGEEERKRINWPKAAERIAWQRFEEEVECVLESTLAGTFV